MVNVRYNGSAPIYLEGFMFSKGDNIVPEVIFRKMLRYPTFQSRIKAGIFKVPATPPVRQERKFEKKERLIAELDEVVEEGKNSEAPEIGSKLSSRKALKAIETSEDREFLSYTISTDKRERIVEAATQRLKFISEEK